MFSWISLEDAVRAFFHILQTDWIKGAVNITSPNPVTQKVFVKTLAKVMRRPCLFAIPSFLVLGEKSRTFLLSSSQVVPDQLMNSGFSFQYSDIKSALLE